MTTPRFRLLVPVKDGHGAKTRLGVADADARAALMAAFARDALTAARRSPMVEVYAVGEPATIGPVVAGLGVGVVADEGAGDLNLALTRAAARVSSPDVAVAVMLADLPCLRTDDLEAALAHHRRGFVADAAGTGTTLLLAPAGEALDPRFGPGSARLHADSGADALVGAMTTLRLDVDTTDDLREALRVGVGAHTRDALTRLGITGP